MSKLQRILWFSLALLFILTGVVFGVWAIWANSHQSNTNNATSTTTTTKGTSSTNLAGTKLQNFTPVSHVASLQKIDTKVGNGTAATPNSTVTVAYTGAVASTGVIFQSSSDNGGQPVSFPLNGVIKGWQEGIPGMKVGGTRRLLIPASLAYGANPPTGSGIPPNADLVFDVTLLSVK